MRAPCTHLQATKLAASTTGTSGIAHASWVPSKSLCKLLHRMVTALFLHSRAVSELVWLTARSNESRKSSVLSGVVTFPAFGDTFATECVCFAVKRLMSMGARVLKPK